jgi:uncharacterized protein (TIGR02246 family)
MQRFTKLFCGLVLLGASAVVSAGPAEEVAQIAAPRLGALESGNIDAYVAAYADNAVFFAAFSPFRIDGKEAIRTYFSELLRMYPKVRVIVRQPSTRVYNDDLVIQNAYFVLNWTNDKGDQKVFNVRGSTTWAKVNGHWLIVDQHVSRLLD